MRAKGLQYKYMAYQKELLLIKPGVRERKIAGEIISRLERKGLDILACKLTEITKAQAASLYAQHKREPFYARLIAYMISGPVFALAVGGHEAVSVCRGLAGATDPLNALPGSIRGDFALSIPDNVVHASDTQQNAAREIAIFFKPAEVFAFASASKDAVKAATKSGVKSAVKSARTVAVKVDVKKAAAKKAVKKA